ncbi:hypothetical protein VPH35_134972 [Triticum aestivum]
MLMLLVSPVFPLAFLGWFLLFFRNKNVRKKNQLMFMCYVLCFAAADLFLWRNKISAGVLAGATAIWLLFEEKALDCCCWSVEDLGSVTALHRLPPADVARAAYVCRLWRNVAFDRVVLEAAFRAPWGVRRVLGDPATRAFWRAASLARFALSRALRRGVTVPDIALKYSVQLGVHKL